MSVDSTSAPLQPRGSWARTEGAVLARELFSGIAHPEELQLLTEALQSYCTDAQIEPHSDEYEKVAKLIMALFTNGAATPEELATALLKHRSPAPKVR